VLAVYNQSAVRDDFEEPNYAMIDTLFSLAEAYLFMQLVELVVSQAGMSRGWVGGARGGGGVHHQLQSGHRTQCQAWLRRTSSCSW
jgi:hypothetical protein